jgi:hypothetical protein
VPANFLTFPAFAVGLALVVSLPGSLQGRGTDEELGRPGEAKDQFTSFVALAPSGLRDLVPYAKQRLAKLQ